MKKTLTFLFTFIIILHVFSQQDKRLKGLDKDLQKIMDVTMAPGFSVAIVDKGQVIYAKGFGYRDVENKIPADENTIYAIGSSTKAFTSCILGKLRQEGDLEFGDSPIKHVPELRFYNDELNSKIIIKDLMCHRTGLPRHDYSWYLFPTTCKDSLVQRIEYQEPFTGLREQWYYNNFMFLLQGVIAERITGKSWEDNIRDRFFKPLGMSSSNVSIDELVKSGNAAAGYEVLHDSIISKMDYYDIAGMSPAGSINSSVEDMANWLITWINGGKFDGQEIIPTAYLTEAIGSQMVVTGALPTEELPDMHFTNYGYGWFLSSYRGHYRVEHGGNIDGFSANVAFFPSDSIGIVVLTNQNASPLPTMVRNTIADRMLNTDKTNWAERFVEKKEEAKQNQDEAKVDGKTDKVENTRPSHILQDYTGMYTNPGYGSFTIVLENDSLFALFKLKKLFLKHYHYDVFEPFEVKASGIDTSDSDGQRLNFSTGNSGDITSVNINVEMALDHPVEFKHTPNTMEVDSVALEQYTGDYEIGGTTIEVYTKIGNTLYLFVPGQPEYELLPTSKHKFSFKALEGFKVEFVESEEGAVNEVIIIQPNGTFKAKRK